LDEIDLLSGPPKRPRKPLYPIISDGTVGRFRNAASSLVLRQIDDAFRAAGIPLGNSGASQFQGQRRTRFMDYIVSADQENPAQVSRLLITLAHMMTELGQQYRDSSAPESFANAFAISFVLDVISVDADRANIATGR
jgi:hypothetical protein